MIPVIALIGGMFILGNTIFIQFTTTAIGIIFYYYLKNKYVEDFKS